MRNSVSKLIRKYVARTTTPDKRTSIEKMMKAEWKLTPWNKRKEIKKTLNSLIGGSLT